MGEKATRQEKLLDSLGKNRFLTIKQLAQGLQVSEMTIRRDVALLEQANKVRTFYGGVSLTTEDALQNIHPYTIDTELIQKTEIKRRIAKKAASLIESHDVILIDTGSTTSCIVDYIPEGSDHTVYCYALNIINRVCEKDSLNVVVCGGYFHKNTRMFESEEGASLIKKTKINKAFMAARGVTDTVGITTAEPYEINVKRAALSVSEQKILLVDSSKFGKAWYAKYADLKEMDIIITDSDIKEEHKQMILDNGILLFIV
ncbi:MAG: DeoR/GlpR family DNA-binding transcription regulator [Spirochaetes bacterium]|nr:DeoR/GlpR family DNA-binding transcription regulator [Spirochaetota bacterium]